MSEPTCPALCYSGAGCLSGVRTYQLGTVLHWCRLFKGCWNLPTGHCVTVVQTVQAVSEPTYRALCYIGAGWLSNSEPTCRALFYSVAECLSGARTYLWGTVLHWCKLLNQCPNQLAGHCVTVVQTVKAVSEPTCQALCYSGADCLSGVRTYIPGIVFHWCRLFKRCWNLPTGHCVTVVQTV